MKNKNTFNLLALICFVSLSLWSCVDNNDYGLPKLEENCVVDDPNQTISSIESLVKNFTGAKEITEDVVLSGYVISNDAGGNFYQQIIIQDNNSTEYNGIEIDASLKGYNDYFPIGARVKVMAKGLYIAKDRGVVKLGVKDTKYPVGRIPEKEVFQHLKFYCNNEIVAPQPKVYTDISQALQEGNVNTLVRLENVYFKAANGVATFVSKGEKASNTVIADENGNTLDLRTSSFTKWADTPLPRGKGNITLIISKFNDSYQAYINSLSDVEIVDDPNFVVAPANAPTLEAANASVTDYQVGKKVKLHGFISVNGNFSTIKLSDNTAIQIQAKRGLWATLPQEFKDKMNTNGQEVTVTGTFTDFTLKNGNVVKELVYEAESDVVFGTGSATPAASATMLEANTATVADYVVGKKVMLHGVISVNGSFSTIKLSDNTTIQIQAKRGLWATLPQEFKDKMNTNGQEVTVTGTFTDFTPRNSNTVVKELVYESQDDVTFGNVVTPAPTTTPTTTTPNPPSNASNQNANVIDFESITETSNSYSSTGSINANDGVVATYVARTDLDKFPIEGKGVMLKKEETDKKTNELKKYYLTITFPRGVKTVEFNYRSAFGKAGDSRALALYNGDVESTNEVKNIDFTVSDDTHTETVTINSNSEYKLTFKSLGKQVVIDNIKWTY